jgi:hypothetical protein
MSQKAWMNAYTKGSKSLQARLAKIHANNPEFQDFVKKHGFGGNLSVKQSGLQKKSSIGVQQTDKVAPTKGPVDREAMIRAAAEKLRDRKLAGANRAAFGGELGGGWSVPNMSFRTYRESREASFKKGDKVFLRKDWAGEHAGLVFTVHHTNADGQHWIGRGKDKRGWYVNPDQIRHQSMKEEALTELSKDRLKWYVKHALRNMNDLDDMGGANFKKTVKRAMNVQKAKRKMAEDIAYKDGHITMYKGGWIAKRDGKRLGPIVPTKHTAMHYIDSTRESLGKKIMKALAFKKQSVARARYATESAANRRRIRSWDSAIMPEMRPLTVKPKKAEPPFTPDKPKKNLGIVVGKNDPGYSKARHLARLGLRKAMEQNK